MTTNRIIVRASGERTQKACIDRAKTIGPVDVLEGLAPFVEVLRATYELALQYQQDYVPVIDADVLLHDGTIERAMEELKRRPNVFCYDGRTQDKILCKVRRAGIHIYNRALLRKALNYVQDSIKPETRVRQAMAKNHNGLTYTGTILFGQHDYDQYYKDLWRKSYLQTQKLGKTLGKNSKLFHRIWPKYARTDMDYRIILEAHRAGLQHVGVIPFDARCDFGAKAFMEKHNITEKEPLQ